MSQAHQAIEQMEATLREEALLLRAGDFQKIADLDAKKRRAWASLQKIASEPPLPDLSSIRSIASQNARLLIAAREGVEAARAMRKALEDGPRPLKTYGADGRKATISISRQSQSQTRSV